MNTLIGLYPWIKALHLISVIAWMAGMLYLPRLYVYHCEVPAGGAQSELFKLMERRLMRGIINPAMIATFLFGILLLSIPGIVDWHQGWLHAKLAFVLLLVVLHIFLSRWRRDFAYDRNQHSARFYRIVNEVPAVLMVFIVILVIVKPF